MSVAKVYADGIGNVCFDLGKLHLEFIASAILTEIKGVLEYDKTGYIVIDTNYGEEFYDLGEAIKELGIDKYYDISEIMSSITNWRATTHAKRCRH